jgi:hypothetical protein
MKKTIYTSIVKPAHAYTRSNSPWLLDINTEAKGETSTGKKFGWKLFHYISGGGIQCFSRTVEQEEIDAKRTRFLISCSVAAVVWMIFYFV